MKRILILAALLAGCESAADSRTKQQNPDAMDPVLYRDRATGCEYLTTGQFNTLTPRIAADGKTHMGCKGA
jgi:hypothetical protein